MVYIGYILNLVKIAPCLLNLDRASRHLLNLVWSTTLSLSAVALAQLSSVAAAAAAAAAIDVAAVAALSAVGAVLVGDYPYPPSAGLTVALCPARLQ